VKVLLDEDLPHKLRAHLPGHEIFTVAYVGWCGLKNGELLTAAEEAGFDVLVTGDQSMPNEQNLSGRKLAIVTLSAIEWPIISEHVNRIALAIAGVTPGSSTRVECGTFQRPPIFGGNLGPL
jgi:hypothetical protein